MSTAGEAEAETEQRMLIKGGGGTSTGMMATGVTHGPEKDIEEGTRGLDLEIVIGWQETKQTTKVETIVEIEVGPHTTTRVIDEDMKDITGMNAGTERFVFHA